jgi:hypothetical protein
MTTPKLPNGYPLSWPDGWDRVPTHKRHSAAYRMTFADARAGVLKSLAQMGAQPVVITANLPLRLDGLPLAGTKEPADPGVAVWWFDRKSGETRTIACDAWKTTRENLRAIGHALEGLRTIERSKSTQILDRAMQSFNVNALPAASSVPARPWFCDELGLTEWPSTRNLIENAYRHRAKQTHPDQGGSHEEFVRLGQARAEALKAAMP